MSHKKGYMCGIDWQHELCEVPDGTMVFGSVKMLKAVRNCTDECGIVEVEVRLVKWVKKQDLFKNVKKKKK
jgi:hypothetical protein